VTHVDVVPQHKDDAVVALEQLAEESQRHGGNVRFDVWQQTNRPNHFTVVETWSSRRTFDAHSMAGETRDFRSKLAGMTGALYDERLYRKLH
jgi:quinol monooxygenase YgiN